jgi:hypothetical protein
LKGRRGRKRNGEQRDGGKGKWKVRKKRRKRKEEKENERGKRKRRRKGDEGMGKYGREIICGERKRLRPEEGHG